MPVKIMSALDYGRVPKFLKGLEKRYKMAT